MYNKLVDKLNVMYCAYIPDNKTEVLSLHCLLNLIVVTCNNYEGEQEKALLEVRGEWDYKGKPHVRVIINSRALYMIFHVDDRLLIEENDSNMETISKIFPDISEEYLTSLRAEMLNKMEEYEMAILEDSLLSSDIEIIDYFNTTSFEVKLKYGGYVRIELSFVTWRLLVSSGR